MGMVSHLQFDVVPDVGEGSVDDGRFNHGGRGWDGGVRHLGLLLLGGFLCFGIGV